MQIRNLLAATLMCSLTIAAVPALAASHPLAKKPTTTTLSTSIKSLAKGKRGTLNVKVKPATASGEAVLYYKLLPKGTPQAYGYFPVTKGVGIDHPLAGDVGKYELWVVYAGNKSYEKSTSNSVTVTVTK
jgi:hypothetical protein